jgi:putative ABC transport system ATP-binding protein
MSPALLRVERLAKHYGGVAVFEQVTFDVAPGEILAVLGESGVGKSTLLNALAGLDAASTGSVELAGCALQTLGDTALTHWRRANVGFVFQAFHMLPHLSVAHNVALPLLLLGRPDPQRVSRMLAAVGLAGFEDRQPRTLSGGQLQRVAIARALVHRPPLVLADEPTGNLDPDTGARVIELLATQVRTEGAACVLVTHSSAAAARADRVVRLSKHGIQAT